MEYEILLTDKASRQLLSLPAWLQGIVESHLEELARSPSVHSRPVVSPPHPPGGMVFEFNHGPVDGKTHHIAVFFHFSQDESALHVKAIGYT
jgi:hypothetical protein